MGERLRIGVSVAASTVQLLDELIAQGTVDNRSAAIDFLAASWRQWQVDADLVSAASDADPSDELEAPGVVGATAAARWPSVTRPPS